MTSFSIITVVFNDATHIKETMDSVINQSYKKNIEYILIDGGSTDDTKEAILECITSCANITKEERGDIRYYLEATHTDYPTLTFKFLSEKDRGIYDAMNKGIALATKEWINFMNCGDRFYNLEVLEKVANENITECDVVYGDTEIDYKTFKRLVKSPSNPHKLHMMFQGFCHQSFFIRSSIHKEHLFDQSLKIASDYNTILDLYIKHFRFKKLNLTISSFSSGGINDEVGIECTKEVYHIAITKAHGHPSVILQIHLFYYPYTIIKRHIKKYLLKP